ncbi:hypothetical protein M0802_011451 [Mischocyttarus mexicanus]|nr:hypothetical protein M0802_011451 [Mischocyttarus mexicanus]
MSNFVCKPFNFSRSELWFEWIYNLEQLMEYYNVESEKEKINILFRKMGPIAKELMMELKPNFEKEMSYEEIKTEFTKYFNIKTPHVIVERQKFNSRVKQPNETIDAFTTDLLKLVGKCEYGLLENYVLRERILHGIGYCTTPTLIDAMNDFAIDEIVSKEKKVKT